MPFTPEQFFQVFERYNLAVYPMQIVLILAACAAVAAATTSRRRRFSGEIIAGLLAFLWLWAGVVYHLIFFAKINPAARIFGAAFVLEGLLFFREGVWKKRLSFRFERGLDGALGAVFIVYALIVYPLVGYWLGRVFPSSPTFGAPCPTTIFTFGLLFWAGGKLPLYLLIVPVLWAFVATSAALEFRMKEDFGLLVAGTIGAAFIMRRRLALGKESFL